MVLRCAKRGFAADARARRRYVCVPYDICACTLSMSFLRMDGLGPGTDYVLIDPNEGAFSHEAPERGR